jgi:hypothetical protein
MRLLPIAALAVAIAGCASSDSDPGPVSSGHGAGQGAGKESHVFEVKSSADLPQLRIEYMRMWATGSPADLVVTIAPGADLQPTGWALEPEHPGEGKALIDVVIKGGGGVLPLPDRVFARSLRIQDVILTGGRSGPSEMWVSNAFAIRRSMLVDARLTDPRWQGGVVEIFADGGSHSGTDVSIEDCWFVRNYQSERPARMLSFTQRGQDAGYFSKVKVARSAFLGNAFGADLAVEYARAVSIEGSLFFRPWTGDGTEISCSHCEGVVVTGSTFALERADQAAAVEQTQPVLFQGSRVYARGWKAGAAPPAALDRSTEVADRAAFAGEAAAAEAITRATTQPLQLPAPDAFAALARAFGG